jgi:hypothetical protein
MSRDWYIAPAGSGVSGLGGANDPIVGLSSVNNNAIGATSGDRFIFLPGTHIEQFNVPIDNLTLLSSGIVLFDGTCSLNGTASISTTTGLEVSTGASWIQVSSSPNIWKKGCNYTGILFVDDVWLEPMPTSLGTNVEGTITAAIQEFEWTSAAITTGSFNKTLYIRLPSGTNPTQFNIRVAASKRLTTSDTVAAGLVQAINKTGITFEGDWRSRGVYNYSGFGAGFYFERCTDLINPNGIFNSSYCFQPLQICAGDRVRVQLEASYCYNCPGVEAATNLPVPTVYTGGEVEVYNWKTNFVGWMPRYGGGSHNISFSTDGDGGIGVGYKGGTLGRVIIRNGSCTNGGPSINVNKTGWANAGTVVPLGSGVYVGTADTMTVNKIDILNNTILNTRRLGIKVAGSAVTIGTTSIIGNVIKDLNGIVDAGAGQYPIIDIGEPTGNVLAGNHVVANNTLINCKSTTSGIRVKRVNAASTIKITNNLFQDYGYATGWGGSQHGFIYISDAISTGITIDANNLHGVSANYARINVTPYANITTWKAALNAISSGMGTLEQSGTVTFDANYVPSAGTANPIETGFKYWGTGARPEDINGEPFPDVSINIGAVQTTNNTFHPKNIK